MSSRIRLRFSADSSSKDLSFYSSLPMIFPLWTHLDIDVSLHWNELNAVKPPVLQLLDCRNISYVFRHGHLKGHRKSKCDLWYDDSPLLQGHRSEIGSVYVDTRVESPFLDGSSSSSSVLLDVHHFRLSFTIP